MPLGPVLTFPCLMLVSDKREISASYFENGFSKISNENMKGDLRGRMGIAVLKPERI